MRTCYFDCFSGASGDMIVGALVDLGVPPGRVRRAVTGLRIPGLRVSFRKVQRGGLSATQFVVRAGAPQTHRGLRAIRRLLRESDLPAAAPDPDLNVIRMKIGRVRRPWVKNCVAIGLAGGFLEPLESTAIAMTEASARWLAGLLPDRQMSPEIAARFNAKVDRLYDEVRDFIVTQYYTSNRPEPFWRAARDDIEVPAALKENLKLWRHILPNITDTDGSKLFNYWSYIYTLWAKGYFEDTHFPLEGSIARRDWDEFGRNLNGITNNLLAALPDHYQLLSSIRGDAPITGDSLDPAQPFEAPPELKRKAQMRPTIPIP